MSSTLDSIIRRGKKDASKSGSTSSSKSTLSSTKKEENSWSTSSWVIIAVVVVIVLIIAFVVWYMWRTPAVKATPSILDEMKSISPGDGCRKTSEVPGVVSLATFREYNSRFSRNFSDTDIGDF